MTKATATPKTARDVPIPMINRCGYGHLPVEFLEDWAIHQMELSTLYKKGKIGGTSTDPSANARKEAILKRVFDTLVRRSNFKASEITRRLNEIDAHLEDPGLLANFEYFDIPSSDFMLQFYFAVWDRRIAEVMGYLHNYGKDLQGIIRAVDTNDIWYLMSYYEGMNINERKKSQDVVDFINTHDIVRATSFGGGNIPERLYGLPKDLELTVFDDGPVSPLEELFPDVVQQLKVNYIHKPLSKAPSYKDLQGTQQLVWMHGVSMYLDEKGKNEMTGAILCGASLLESGGFMKYDYLVWTDSMRRVIQTQNWPYDPRNPMVVFDNAADAIKQGRATLERVNAKLGGSAFMDALDPAVTLVEPWGVTSVRFTVQKNT